MFLSLSARVVRQLGDGSRHVDMRPPAAARGPDPPFGDPPPPWHSPPKWGGGGGRLPQKSTALKAPQTVFPRATMEW